MIYEALAKAFIIIGGAALAYYVIAIIVALMPRRSKWQ